MGSGFEFSTAIKSCLLILFAFGANLQRGGCVPPGHGDQYKNMKNVYLKILENHNPLIPPTVNVTIEALLHLTQIRKVDTLNQKMISTAYLELFWDDPSLTWNTFDAPGMNYVSLPPSQIWTPKLALFNPANDASGVNGPEILTGGNVMISPEGHVTWHIYPTFHSSCTIDVTYYPFDQQTCLLKIAAIEPAHQIGIGRNYNYAILDEFYLSVEWDIIEVPLYLNVYPAKLGEYGHSDLTYYFTVRRRPHWISQVLPSLAVAIVTLIPALLPHSRFQEKIMIQLVSLIGISGVYWEVAAKLPPTTLVLPHIFKYLLPLAIFNLLHLILTCLLSHFGNSGCGKQTRSKCTPKEKMFSGPTDSKQNHEEDFVAERSGFCRNGRWLGIVEVVIFVVLLFGVGLVTAKFFCDTPHLFEKVEARKIIEMYSL